jgi:hypothetical protein
MVSSLSLEQGSDLVDPDPPLENIPDPYPASGKVPDPDIAKENVRIRKRLNMDKFLCLQQTFVFMFFSSIKRVFSFIHKKRVLMHI